MPPYVEPPLNSFPSTQPVSTKKRPNDSKKKSSLHQSSCGFGLVPKATHFVRKHWCHTHRQSYRDLTYHTLIDASAEARVWSGGRNA